MNFFFTSKKIYYKKKNFLRFMFKNLFLIEKIKMFKHFQI